MKIKPIVSVLFLSCFSIYILCPALMQGNCEPSLSDSKPTKGDSQHCHRETLPTELHWDLKQVASGHKAACCVPTSGREEGDSDAPQQQNPQVGNCCFIGLEFTFPNESNLDLSHLLRTAFSLTAVLPVPSALFASYEMVIRPPPFLNLYEYFPVYQIFPRAPPHSSLQFSHI